MSAGEPLRHRGVSGAFWAAAKPLMGSISRYIDRLRNGLFDSPVLPGAASPSSRGLASHQGEERSLRGSCYLYVDLELAKNASNPEPFISPKMALPGVLQLHHLGVFTWICHVSVPF